MARTKNSGGKRMLKSTRTDLFVAAARCPNGKFFLLQTEPDTAYDALRGYVARRNQDLHYDPPRYFVFELRLCPPIRKTKPYAGL